MATTPERSDMETYTVRDQDDEILATFHDEDEAFTYASHLANAFPDNLYAVYGEPQVVRPDEPKS